MDSKMMGDFITIPEKDMLEKLGVDLQPNALIFREKLSENDLRKVGLVLVSLMKRFDGTSKPEINFEEMDDQSKWAIGDWLAAASDWYGEIDQSIKWLNELIILNEYKDHLLKLTGTILIQLQGLEHLIKVCCGLLGVKKTNKKGYKERFSYKDLLSPDPRHRKKTLGWLKDALKEQKDNSGDKLFSLEFEDRLDKFVKDRNDFTHVFWIDTFTGGTYSNPPSIDSLYRIEKFLLNLFREAYALTAPFYGLFYTIVKESSEREHIRNLENSLLTSFSEYEKYQKDFIATRKK